MKSMGANQPRYLNRASAPLGQVKKVGDNGTDTQISKSHFPWHALRPDALYVDGNALQL